MHVLAFAWHLITSGVASFYTRASSGAITASGLPMDDSKAICAMRHIRLGTLIRVVNVSNGRSATCRVDDRGPYVGDRIIDVSLYVKQKLHMGGLAYVKVYARY